MGKIYPQVRVVWLDAESHDEWIDIADINSECKEIVTLGHLIEDYEDQLVLAMNYDSENASVSMTMTLPNHWVVSIEYL